MDGIVLDPTPELPDDTPISDVNLSTRIRNVLAEVGIATVGQVRANSAGGVKAATDGSRE